MDLYTTRYLGGVGALLMFISFLPFVGTYTFGVLGLVGLILLMIAAKGLADYYQEDKIFNNALYGVILAIVGVVAFVGVAVFALIGFFSQIGMTLGFNTFWDWQSWTAIDWQAMQDAILGSGALVWLGYIALALVVLFVFVVAAAIFVRKSIDITSKKTGVRLFGTTGTMLLVGAVLTIILIGLLLLWISLLLIAIAFFQITAQPAQAPPPP